MTLYIYLNNSIKRIGLFRYLYRTMKKLLNILLEITLSPEQLTDIVKKGYILSVVYRPKGNKTWLKIKPLNVVNKGGQNFLQAEVLQPDGTVKVEELKASDIININRTSTKKDFDGAAKASNPNKPLGQDDKKPVKAKAASTDTKSKKKMVQKPSADFIIDLIKNNRVARIYYMGDKENKPGWRTILPVAYGRRTTESGGSNDYIRAWQWEGQTITGIPKWKLFRKDRIKNWDLSNTQVVRDVPDPRYNPTGDKWMDVLYVNSKFKGSNNSNSKKQLEESLIILFNAILNS